MIKNFRELHIWTQGVEIACLVYHLTDAFPKHQRYSLVDQLQRASISIASNIAEGQERGSVKEFIRFLRISRGSISELETQMTIAHKLNYISLDELVEILGKTQTEKKMINSLITKLNERISPKPTH